jgi:hypothetical protein
MSNQIKKILSITTLISALHFVEDAILFIIGRYTEVTFPIVMVGVVSVTHQNVRACEKLCVMLN